jgi:site-specific DNA recombinase
LHRRLARTIGQALTSERIEILRSLDARVVVDQSRVEVTIRIDGLGRAKADRPVLASTSVAVQLRQSGPGIKLVVKGADHGNAGPNPKLVNLLSKAGRWFEQLKSGHSASVLSIAQDHGLTTKEVTRVIYLAFLAPDIVQCIAQGTEPVGLAMKDLLDAAPLPLAWDEQRRVLGFAS